MERISIAPRPDWKAKVEQWGLIFHTEDDVPYWNESAYYSFTVAEIDLIERSTNELERLCNEAIQHVIDKNRFSELGISDEAASLIRWAWEAEPPSLYGRFDLMYDGMNPPKMLEYNADTPTALLEAAVVQWKWLEERFPEADQFNSVWEGLVGQWKWLKDERKIKGLKVHFAHADTTEDQMTVALLRDTAHEAGLETEQLLMGEIGWHNDKEFFVDLADQRMWTIFKLYPYEWLVKEEFGQNMIKTYRTTQWIEPIWKMVVSNKAILAILWELFPGHPNLLPAYLDGPREMTDYVKKALLGREGANVTVVKNGVESFESPGQYGDEGFIYQAMAPVKTFGGITPVIGSWIVGGEARGIGIRESTTPVTDNFSQFVPHLFKG